MWRILLCCDVVGALERERERERERQRERERKREGERELKVYPDLLFR